MAERDFRTINMTDGQQIENDQVVKRIGDISYRDFGVFCKALLFDSQKALVTKGLRVVPSSGLTVSIPVGTGAQRIGDQDILPFVSISAQTVTIDAASGSPRTDIVEAQVQAIAVKPDTTFGIVDPENIIVSQINVDRDIQYILAVQKKTSSSTPTPATAGLLTGTVAIPGTIDLSTAYLINVADGEDGAFIEVDCRGGTPEATTLAEIIANINAAVGRTATSVGTGNVLEYTGEGTGITSAFYFKSPPSDANLDALAIITGLSIAGAYSYAYVGTNEWFKIAEIAMGASTTVVTATELKNLDEKEIWTSNASDIILSLTAFEQMEANNIVIKESFYSNWSAIAAAEANGWQSVAYGNGVFVVVASSGTNRVMRSVDDGANWSAIAAAEANVWTAVAYGNDVFVAVSNDGTNRVMRSVDYGASWSAIAAAEANSWQSVAYGNGVFIAISPDGTNRVMRSVDDGANWSAIAATEANSWKSVTYGNGVFVAVSNSGTNQVMRSVDDGASWSAIAAAEANAWNSVAYGNGVFVVVANDGTNRVMRSVDDGASWSAIAATEANAWRAVAYGNGVFVATSNISTSTGDKRIMLSVDSGQTWSDVTAPEVEDWESVAYGNGIFVAIESGSSNITMRTLRYTEN